MRIYVAGPFTAPDARQVQANVNEAIRIGCALMRKGHSVYIPHLSHYIWLHPDGDFEYEHWMAQCKVWLKQCSALFYISPSPGADMELGWAVAAGKIIYTRLEDVP